MLRSGVVAVRRSALILYNLIHNDQHDDADDANELKGTYPATATKQLSEHASSSYAKGLPKPSAPGASPGPGRLSNDANACRFNAQPALYNVIFSDVFADSQVWNQASPITLQSITTYGSAPRLSSAAQTGQ